MHRSYNNYNNYNEKPKMFSTVMSMNKHIVDYIFSTIDISKFNYKILKYDNELELLLKQKRQKKIKGVYYDAFRV